MGTFDFAIPIYPVIPVMFATSLQGSPNIGTGISPAFNGIE